MTAKKTVAMSFRFTPDFKVRLTALAALEHRSQANVLEKLVYDHAERLGVRGTRRRPRHLAIPTPRGRSKGSA